MENKPHMDNKGAKPMPMGGKPEHDENFTDKQLAKIQDILSNYDAEHLTEEDVHDMFEQIRKENSHPGDGMKEAVEDAGFDLDLFRTDGSPPSHH
jgi:hypothetical protein